MILRNNFKRIVVMVFRNPNLLIIYMEIFTNDMILYLPLKKNWLCGVGAHREWGVNETRLAGS